MLVANLFGFLFFFFKQKTAYEMRISDWSSDVCSSDLADRAFVALCLAIVIGIEPTLPSPVGIAANHRRRTMAKDHGSQIKDDETYEALRDDGASKEKADRIANARAGGSLDPIGRASSGERVYKTV